MEGIIVNCVTGEQRKGPLTAKQSAALRERAAIHDAERVAQDEREKAKRDAIAQWDSCATLKGTTPEEICTLMQARIDAWKSLADAQKDLREWLPLMASVAQLVAER